MRSNYFILASFFFFFFFGYGSATAFPQEIEQSSIDSVNIQDGNVNITISPLEGQSSTSNDLFSEQSSTEGSDASFVLNGETGESTTAISLLNTASEVREYLISKIDEIQHKLKGRKNKNEIEQATQLDFEHLPEFQDPLYIGNFTKSYKLADVAFTNVKVRNLANFRNSDVQINQKERTVDLYLVVHSLTITGKYVLSNYFKKASGPFTVRLIDNVTYHESSIYCRLNQEVDIAASECGIRYGKSENDYKNLGFFSQLFRGAISNPLINEVLQKVGREVGHKMRPLLQSKLREVVLEHKKTEENSDVVAGLEAFIRSSVSETRNLMLKEDYKNIQLNGIEEEKEQYGIYDATIRNIFLSNMNTFEISSLKIPVQNDEIVIDLIVDSTKIKGSVDIMFVQNDGIQPKSTDYTSAVLPFDVGYFKIQITLRKQLSNDSDKFKITNVDVTLSNFKTNPTNSGYNAQIDAALRESLPNKLTSTITKRLTTIIKSNIENILQQVSLE